MRHTFALLIAALAAGAPAPAAILLSDTFDSYADTAALGGVWTLGAGQTLDTAAGNPGQSVNHNGSATVATRAVTGVYPAAGETLIFEADLFDDGLSANKRVTAGLRNAAGNSLIEMGFFNSPSHYAIRTVLFGPGSGGVWVAFPSMVDDLGASIVNAPRAGWHTFRGEITNSSATFTIDLNGDGNINGTITVPVFQNGTNLFNQVRVGGPSALSSAGGGAKFDNVLLELVPEPSAALLALVGGVAALRRRG